MAYTYHYGNQKGVINVENMGILKLDGDEVKFQEKKDMGNFKFENDIFFVDSDIENKNPILLVGKDGNIIADTKFVTWTKGGNVKKVDNLSKDIYKNKDNVTELLHYVLYELNGTQVLKFKIRCPNSSEKSKEVTINYLFSFDKNIQNIKKIKIGDLQNFNFNENILGCVLDIDKIIPDVSYFVWEIDQNTKSNVDKKKNEEILEKEKELIKAKEKTQKLQKILNEEILKNKKLEIVQNEAEIKLNKANSNTEIKEARNILNNVTEQQEKAQVELTKAQVELTKAQEAQTKTARELHEQTKAARELEEAKEKEAEAQEAEPCKAYLAALTNSTQGGGRRNKHTRKMKRMKRIKSRKIKKIKSRKMKSMEKMKRMKSRRRKF